MDAQVDRYIEHPGAFREVHPEEEDVAPAAMGQVHPYGGALAQDRMRRVAAAPPQQFGPDPKGLVQGVPEAKHPGVSPSRPYGVAHLVGERLKPERVVRCRQGARQRLVGALGGLCPQEVAYGLLKAPFQHAPKPS